MSNNLDYEMTSKALLKLQMNLVLKELTKIGTTVGRCGGIALRSDQRYWDVKRTLGDMKHFNSKKYYYAGKKFSIKDFFNGMVYGNKVYNDKRCGLYGLKSTIWKTNYNLQADLKRYWNMFQSTKDAEHFGGLSLAGWNLDTYKKSTILSYLVKKYWKKDIIYTGHTSADLWDWNRALDWVFDHYNEDYIRSVEESGVYLDSETLPVCNEKIQELEKFINSFGEEKENDLTQIMGNDLYTRNLVKGMWNSQLNTWGTTTMENYLQELQEER